MSTAAQTQIGWGFAAAKLLATADPRYRISSMYIEYVNCDSPDDVPENPLFDRTAGYEYYSGLESSPDRDFLRVSLLLDPAIAVAAGYDGFLNDGEGNQLTLYAQTSGNTGFHGKPFNHSVNSKIVGCAAVVSPVPLDASSDIIVARGYFEPAQQMLKLAAGQLGVTLVVNFI